MWTFVIVSLVLAELVLSGCVVSRWTYKKTQDDLAAAQREQAATAARLQATTQQVGALQQELVTVKAARTATEQQVQERAEQLRALQEQLDAATQAVAQAKAATQQDRELAEKTTQDLHQQVRRLEQEQAARQEAERQMQALRGTVASLSAAAEQAKQREQELLQQAAAEQAKQRELELVQQATAVSLPEEVEQKSAADGSVALTIVASLLFESGGSEISPEGRAILGRLKDKLNEMGPGRIQIEGHTDSKPLKPSLQKRYRSNWELSTARATRVVRFLVMEEGISPERLSAVGHADTRPVASNDTEEGRQQNRRIEIVLYPDDPHLTTTQAEGGQ